MKTNLKIFIAFALFAFLMYFLIILTDAFGWLGLLIYVTAILLVYLCVKLALLIKKHLDKNDKN